MLLCPPDYTGVQTGSAYTTSPFSDLTWSHTNACPAATTLCKYRYSPRCVFYFPFVFAECFFYVLHVMHHLTICMPLYLSVLTPLHHLCVAPSHHLRVAPLHHLHVAPLHCLHIVPCRCVILHPHMISPHVFSNSQLVSVLISLNSQAWINLQHCTIFRSGSGSHHRRT